VQSVIDQYRIARICMIAFCYVHRLMIGIYDLLR
jgi:hypothetical protein